MNKYLGLSSAGFVPPPTQPYQEPSYETAGYVVKAGQYVVEPDGPLATSCGRLNKSIEYLIEIVDKLEAQLESQGFLKFPTDAAGWPKVPVTLSVSPLAQYIQDRTNSIEYLQEKLQVLRDRIDY
jgi:hypothetical protein